MPILYEISYINPLLCTPTHVLVTVSEFGFPSNGWHTSPVKSDFALVLTVGRVGLMARFIRTFVLLHTSSSARLLRTFHPNYWFRRSKFLEKDKEIDTQPESQRQSASSSKRGESSRKILGCVSSIASSVLIQNICSPFFRSQSDFSLADAGRQLEPCKESDKDPPEGFKPTAVRDIFLKRNIKAPKSIEKQNSLTDSPLYNGSNSRSHVGTLSFTSII